MVFRSALLGDMGDTAEFAHLSMPLLAEWEVRQQRRLGCIQWQAAAS